MFHLQQHQHNRSKKRLLHKHIPAELHKFINNILHLLKRLLRHRKSSQCRSERCNPWNDSMLWPHQHAHQSDVWSQCHQQLPEHLLWQRHTNRPNRLLRLPLRSSHKYLKTSFLFTLLPHKWNQHDTPHLLTKQTALELFQSWLKPLLWRPDSL